jgi:hypothetical protein
MASFFVVFEIGYHENDALGARREAAPTLTEARLSRLGTVVEGEAWCVALVFAVPGLALLAAHRLSTWAGDPLAGDPWLLDLPWLLAGWVALLLATRGIFAAFNRINERSRVLLYLLLQAMKGLGIVVALALPVTAAGVALLVAQPIARWIPYVIYRIAGMRWQTPDRLHRLVLVVVVLVALLPVAAIEALSPLGTALVLAWCTLQARDQLRAVWRHGHWLEARPAHPAAAPIITNTAPRAKPRKANARSRREPGGAPRLSPATVARNVGEPVT